MRYRGTVGSLGEHRWPAELAAEDLDLGLQEPDAGVAPSGAGLEHPERLMDLLAVRPAEHQVRGPFRLQLDP